MVLRATRQYADILLSGSGKLRVTRQYVDVLGAVNVSDYDPYKPADHIRVPNPHSPEEVRRAFQQLIFRTDILIQGPDDKILTGTQVDSLPEWASPNNNFTSLIIGNIIIDGASITSNTGQISFANENLVTTGTVAGINVTSGEDPGHTHTGSSITVIDISTNTNLAVTAPIVLTDDTLSLTQSGIDHGSIGGLGDDDHTQYFLVNGTRAFSAYVDFQEISVPAVPAVNNIRVFAVADADFTVLETITDLGIVNRINQDIFRIARNTSGVSIAAGKVVYFTGSTGNKPNFALAKSNTEATIPAIGITVAAVANNAFGEIMVTGRLTRVKTDFAGWTEGAQLYVDPSTAGELTHIRPVHPNIAQWIGTIEVVHANNGAILILTQAITGVESGTNRNTYTIGDTLTGDKTLTFDGATDGTIIWGGTVFAISGGVTTTGTVAAGTVTGINVTSGADPGHTHGGLYYTETELDAGQLDNRYFTEAEHINTSAGAGDAGKPIKLDADGEIAANMLGKAAAGTDHGTLSGLADDDHTQYLLADGTRTLTNNLAVTALKTIDGRDLSVDGSKLDGIESAADVTDATNVAAAGAAMSGGAFHDGFSDFVSDEHVAHAGVTLTAGSGLAGGGTIASNRTFDLDINELTAAAIAADDFVPFWDITVTATNKKILFSSFEAALSHANLTGTHNLTTSIDHNTITNAHNLTTAIDHNTITNAHNLTTNIDHNTITNYDANKHVDHTGVTLTAGSGLSGGGTIAASRTFDLDINELDAATIAAGDFVPFWDITATATNKKILFSSFESTLNHDNLAGFVAAEHVSHPSTIAATLSDHTLTAHTALALREVISTNQTYYLATTGNDSTGDGSVGNPWLTIAKVWSYLAAKSVNADVTITIQLADGTYSYVVSTLSHNDYLTTVVQGTNTYAKTMASVQSSSGGSGAWSIVINLDSVANIAVNDYVIILTASGGTNPKLMIGCHRVTNVDVPNTRITVTNLSLSASVSSGAVACTVTVLKSILSYNADAFPDGLIFKGPQGVTIQNLCLVNSNSAYPDIVAQSGARVTLGKVGLYKSSCTASDHGILIIAAAGCAVGGGDYAFNSSYKSVIYLSNGGVAVTGASGAAILAQTGSYIDVRSSYISGNAIGAQAATGGYVASSSNFYTSNTDQADPNINTQGSYMNFIQSTSDTFA